MNQPADPTDEKQAAVEACSCPRTAGETLPAPKCAPEQYLGDFASNRKGTLFVKGHLNQNCKHSVSYGNGYFCTCANRLQVYEKYGL